MKTVITLVALFALLPEGLKASPLRGNCPDFTGKWRGVCKTATGAEIPTNTKIRQTSCDVSIDIDGENFPLQGTKSTLIVSSPSLGTSQSAVTNVRWQSNDSLALFVVTKSKIGNEAPVEIRGKVVYQLKGNKLEHYAEAGGKALYRCEYSR